MIRTEIVNVFQKKAIIALSVGAASFLMAQQKVNVTGSVKDTDGGVGYASITFTNKQNAQLSDAVLTDVNGNYKIDLAPGNYDVSIDAVDYKKFTKAIDIQKAGAVAPFVIVSDGKANLSNTTEIQGVVITAATKPLKVELDKKTYDVKSDITAIGGNLQDVLQNVPSVSVDPDGTVSMRGSSNVKFLVNGKPSALLGIDDGANALQAIPADQIDKIEVITNPSSKFDASGTAGILNIILKKNTKSGFNGSVVGTLGYNPKTSINANLGWRKGNWNWFLNGGGGYNENKNKNWTDANYSIYPNYNGTEKLQRGYQESNNENTSKNYNATGGVVYSINDNTSVNASATIRSFNRENNSPVSYTDYLDNGTIATGYRNANGQNSNTGFQGDLGLDHKFDDKGQNISFSLSLQQNKSDGSSFVDQDYRSKILQDKINQNTTNKSLVGKIDYELPIGENSTFNAGYKIDNNHNDYQFAVQEKNQGAADFSTLGVGDYNNTTNYRETINAAYAQFKSKFGNFGYQVGLRDEMSNITLNYVNLSGNINDNIYNKHKDYNNLFPSVFLSYNFAKDNQLLLNYSRRIDRPRSFFLVPYMSYNDSQNIFKGNSDLNPSYIDSFEFGYNLSKSKFSINPTLYFRKENDDVKMTLTYDTTKGIFVSQPQNLGYDQRIGLDLNYSYDPFAWWKIMGEVDVYNYKTTGDYFYAKDPTKPENLDGHIPYDGNGYSTRLRMSTTFKVDKTFNFQFQGNYRARQVEGANNQQPMYFVNFGATKTIWKGDGTLAFNVQDIFNTRGRKSLQSGDGYTRESFMQWQPRQISLSLTYRFKQGEKVEQPKKKKDINANDNGNDDQIPPM